MLDTPQLVQTADQLTAYLHLTVPRAEIQTVMGPSIREVYAAIAEQGIAPAGPWFTHHLQRPTDIFDFEVCIPVATPLTAAGRVKPGKWPAMRVARAVYHGPYEGLAAAWGEFCSWIEASGHMAAPDLWERYLVGPESSPNPADWRTELNRPLAPGASASSSTSALRTERLISASPQEIFAAFEQPDRLARWWGPDGFTNTFEQFEFKPGGRWAFVMHGPNGTDYANENVFREVQPDRIVIEHVSQPHFTLTVTLAARGDRTHLVWVQEFDSPEVAEKLRPVCDPANEQNLNRMQAVLAG